MFRTGIKCDKSGKVILFFVSGICGEMESWIIKELPASVEKVARWRWVFTGYMVRCWKGHTFKRSHVLFKNGRKREQ